MRIVRPRSFGSVSGGGGAITHGSQITTANTGHLAYTRVDLGRTQVQGDLTTQAGTHWISDFGAAGSTFTGVHYTGDIAVDVNNITFNGCQFDNPVPNTTGGGEHTGTTFNYCTVSPATAGPWGFGSENFQATRCYIRGNSDGMRCNGGTATQNIIECYVRVKMADEFDHNDAIQNFGGSGTINIRRCNLSADPEGGVLSGGINGGPDAAILFADFTSGSIFHGEVTDCLLDAGSVGSGLALRLYDGALTTNITYVGTGNIFVRRGSAGVHRGTANTTPIGQITWSGNTWQDDGSTVVLS